MARSTGNIRLVIGSAAGLVLAGVLAGCGADTATARPAKTPRPTQPTRAPSPKIQDPPTAALPPELPDGHVRVHGIVFSRQDHPTAPTQRPFAGGTVVAIPSDRFDTYQEQSRGPYRGMILEGRGFPMPAAIIDATDVHTSDLASDGTYTLNVTPGDYTFCVGNLEATTAGQSPPGGVWIDTSFDVKVTADDFQTVVAIFNRATGEVIIHH